LLVTLLAAATAIFFSSEALRSTYELPEGRLVLDTTVVLAATIVAVLAGIRFSVEGRALDLLLGAGFSVAAAGTLGFAVLPVLDGDPQGPVAAWGATLARVLAATLIALAPVARAQRLAARRRALALTGIVLLATLIMLWLVLQRLDLGLAGFAEGGDAVRSFELSVALAALTLLALIAAVGFALRYRSQREDLDSWLAFGSTLTLFAELHYVVTPDLSTDFVTQGDFLRVLAYGILLVGVWRAISFAEFGRAVAEERARVAREIHDGLAQYLFAVSTHTSMLEAGTPLADALPKLKQAAQAAQQEARFAVLALSSASGNAPFDAALRRYVEFLTADGVLDVELDIDAGMQLAPDEQIEIFRIVQEGLANVRKHAGAGRADVSIAQRGGRRVVQIRDDGVGMETDADGTRAGQGLKNMRLRAEGIGADLFVRSAPRRGTTVVVVLRA
jgi:signal transduction histidine kinase